MGWNILAITHEESTAVKPDEDPSLRIGNARVCGEKYIGFNFSAADCFERVRGCRHRLPCSLAVISREKGGDSISRFDGKVVNVSPVLRPFACFFRWEE